MSLSVEKVGEVDTKRQKRVYEVTLCEWRIADFYSLSEYVENKSYESDSFYLDGVMFFFTMVPRNPAHPESAAFYLESKMHRKFSVLYSFGLKKLDDSVEHLQSGVLKGDESYGTPGGKIPISEALQRKSEFLSGNVLTVVCAVKSEILLFSETIVLGTSEELKLIRLDTLSENFKDLSANKETCDVTLIVQGKEYVAHRSVLIARSSVFAANFKHDTLENRTGIIAIPDCDPDSFQQFLDYLYCGKLEQLCVSSALHLYYTSDKYNVQELKAFCVEHLTKCLAVENMCEIVVFAAEYDDIQLLSGIQDFFNKNVRKVLESPEWECLMKKDYRLASKLLKDMAKVKFDN